MKVDDFHSYYNEDKGGGEAAGLLVERLAYLILPDIEASRLIRQEVMEIGSQRCAEFKVDTAWAGDKASQWPGLQKITRHCCMTMLLLPEAENPLAKANLRQWADDPWAHAINALPFEKRQIFLFRVGFQATPRNLKPLLNANRPDPLKYTVKDITGIQAGALAAVIENLIDYYAPE